MKKYSILRENQYRELSKLTLEGAILDIGGRKNSEYHDLPKGKHTIATSNIIPGECDFLFDIQKKFPLADASYDHAICLNVLEHIFYFQNALSETERILKPGGTLVVSTPFLHHIHGCPDDYLRYTDSGLRKALTDAGFVDINIKPIGFGVFSLFYQSISGALPGIIGITVKKILVSFDKAFLAVSKRYRRVAERVPLGYFVTARKKDKNF